jgi:GTPase SAR1 family protein
LDYIRMFIEGQEKLETFAGPLARPRVAVLGAFNAGKSTLVNNLLGGELSPVGAIPSTFQPLHFVYGATFKATVTRGRQKFVFRQRDDFHSFLNQLKAQAGRVTIECPAPLLKKCSLVDTPGIDSFHGEYTGLAEQEAREADMVIYLFHQRGIEDFNRLFLYKLSSFWKKRHSGSLSFWLNCNLGLTDGSSLELTRSALREIFLSRMRLNTINTFKKDNIEFLRLFLEVELARAAYRQASSAMQKREAELSQRMNKIVKISNDSLFLSSFWEIQETAARIIEVRRILHTLPSVVLELEQLSDKINCGNIEAGTGMPVGRPYRPGAAGIKEGKEDLLELLNRLLKEKKLESYLDKAKLTELYNRVAGKRFTVAAAGGFSTGKSTFFNALLKDDLLPRADGPTTPCVTRITYGRQKRAVVHYPLQVTLKMYDLVGNMAGLRREEAAALENWLLAANSPVAFLEAGSGRCLRRVERREMLQNIKRLKELFAAGSFARTKGSPVLPAAFKPVPLKGLRASGAVEEVRVTFKDAGIIEFDLSNPPELDRFKRLAAGRENFFRIDLVEIQHPGEYLKLAEFIDTPGLDWIQKHHYRKTRRFIQQCDVYLIFFNAKHILNNMDKEHFEALFGRQAHGFIKKGEVPDIREGNYFFLINFADVLSPAQQEAVANFVRRKLASPSAPEGFIFTNPGVFLISALKGLTGEDGGLLRAFLKRLEEGILGYSGRAFYLASVEELFLILNDAFQRIRDSFLDGTLSFEQKKHLREAQDFLRQSSRRLKEIRSAVYFSKSP